MGDRERSRWRRPAFIGMGAVVAVAVAVAVAVSGTTRDGDPDDRAGSELVATTPAQALDPAPEPDAFRIDYRVEVGPVEDALVSADRLLVQRPFVSRLEAYDGPVVEGAPGSVEISAFGRQRAEGGGDAEAVVVAVPPSPGLTDTRIRDALDDALSDGRVERRERRAVLGRACDVYRSRAPLAASDLLAPREDEYTDTCIDASGLVLEELATFDGARIARRLAIEVDLEPDLAVDLFDTGDPTLATDDGGGFLAEVVPGSRAPGRFWELAGPPSGFTLAGRYAVIPPQAQNFSDPDRRGERRTFVSDVFIDGIDVIVFDQGATLGNVDPFRSFDGVAIDVAGFDDVAVSYGRGGPIVLADLGDGRFLRVRGTVAPPMLVAMLSGVTQVEGGELELLDPPS